MLNYVFVCTLCDLDIFCDLLARKAAILDHDCYYRGLTIKRMLLLNWQYICVQLVNIIKRKIIIYQKDNKKEKAC